MAAADDSAQQHCIPADDRAFLYGDGLFETLLCVDGVPLWPTLHLDRLMRGAERLAIAVYRSEVARMLGAAASETEGVVALRLTVSRRGEQRGYAPTPDSGSRVVMSVTPLDRDPCQPLPALQVGIAATTLALQPLLAGIKHCNRLEQVLGAAEAADRALDDVLMTAADGYLRCSTNANLFALFGSQLRTPRCSTAGVAGTRRRLITRELAPAAGLTVVECDLGPQDLLTADAVFLTNSLMGIRRVEGIDGHAIPWPALATNLQNDYFRAVDTCIGS